MTVIPTEHFKDQAEGLYKPYLGSWEAAYQQVVSKMRHQKRGVHWVLVARLGREIFMGRQDTPDKRVNGDVLIAVVRPKKYSRDLSITTVFVRRDKQRKKCRYYWE